MRTLIATVNNQTLRIHLPSSLPALKCAQLAESIDRTLHVPVHIVGGNGVVMFDTALDSGCRFIRHIV
jgi:hypothetical protein